MPTPNAVTSPPPPPIRHRRRHHQPGQQRCPRLGPNAIDPCGSKEGGEEVAARPEKAREGMRWLKRGMGGEVAVVRVEDAREGREE